MDTEEGEALVGQLQDGEAVVGVVVAGPLIVAAGFVLLAIGLGEITKGEEGKGGEEASFRMAHHFLEGADGLVLLL